MYPLFTQRRRHFNQKTRICPSTRRRKTAPGDREVSKMMLPPVQKRVLEFLLQAYQKDPIEFVTQDALEKQLDITGYAQFNDLRLKGWICQGLKVVPLNPNFKATGSFVKRILSWKLTVAGAEAVKENQLFQLPIWQESGWKHQVRNLLQRVSSRSGDLQQDATWLLVTMDQQVIKEKV